MIFEDNEHISSQRMSELEGALELMYLKYIVSQAQFHLVRTYGLCVSPGLAPEEALTHPRSH